MKPLIFYILTVLFLTSCSANSDNNLSQDKAINLDTITSLRADSNKMNANSLNDSDEFGISEPQIVTDTSIMQITSINDTLYKGDTLTINFKVPHHKELAIRTPKDTLFFVVYSNSDNGQASLVDWDKFANQKTLQIITNKTKANPWYASIKTNQLIFKETGNYQINLSENLETDDGTPVEIKNVYYIDRPRKK